MAHQIPSRTASTQRMEAENYLHQQLKEHTVSCGAPDDNSARSFITTGAIDSIFEALRRQRRLQELLKPHQEHGTSLNSLSAGVLDHCRRIYCILLRLGRPRLITHFIQNTDLHDSRLPFTEPPPSFPKLGDDLWEKFEQQQAVFCPVKLTHCATQSHAGNCILPIIVRSRIAEGQGHSAEVYRAEVHKDCDGLRKDTQFLISESSGNRVVAVKIFRGDRYVTDAWREARSFGRIQGTKPVPGLIEFFGLHVQRDQCYLLLEYADRGTLEDYFQNHEQPSTMPEILAFYKSLSKVIQALVKIHEIQDDSTDGTGQHKVAGLHQDIKTANILALSDGPDRLAFKLGDLGLAHFLSTKRDQQNVQHLAEFGTTTYGAPEVHRSSSFEMGLRIPTTNRCDVWSIGCVFLEAIVWVLCGKRELERFRLARIEENALSGRHNSPGDCFHDGRGSRPEILDVVREKLWTLTDDMKRADKLSQPLLEVLMGQALQSDPNLRPGALQLWRSISRCLEQEQSRATGRHLRTTWQGDPSSRTVDFPEQRTPFNGHMRTFSDPRFVTEPGRLGSQQSSNAPEHLEYQYPHQEASENASREHSTGNKTGYRHSNDPKEWGEGRDVNRIIPPGGSQSGRGFNEQVPANHKWAARDIDCAPNGTLAAPRTHTRPPSAPQSPNSLSNVPRPVHSAKEGKVPYVSMRDAATWRQSIEGWHPRNLRNKLVKPQLKDDYIKFALKGREHIFVVDNAQSMKAHWPWVLSASKPLTYIVKECDDNGLDLYFTDVKSTKRTFTKTTEMCNAIESMEPKRPGARTSMSTCLRSVMEYCRTMMNANQWKPPPISIYVLTDGVWAGSGSVAELIEEMIHEMKRRNLGREDLGIQFISFGDDPDALRRLNDLDQLGKRPDLNLDIVDTEPHDGNVWKMLLGAVNSKLDADDDDAPRSNRQ